MVLDAGHGGKDAGAVGTNKVFEKDVNLAVALKVGDLIRKNLPGVKVIYTRDDDRFVELYKRGKIANEKEGDLFISIHCNSTPERNSKARGTEVYLLRPGKTKDAIDIAKTENSVIKYEDDPARYKELDDENYILTSMAHAAYMHHSEKFAGLLNKSFKEHTDRASRGVKQAGFYVLVGASMPNVLIELGFISNVEEEKYLASEKGQNQLAKAIFEGIKSYKDYYDIANNN